MLGRMQLRAWRAERARSRLARVCDPAAVSTEEEHQARIVIVDGRGFQRVGFPIDQATPERIAHDVRLLEQGALVDDGRARRLGGAHEHALRRARRAPARAAAPAACGQPRGAAGRGRRGRGTRAPRPRRSAPGPTRNSSCSGRTAMWTLPCSSSAAGLGESKLPTSVWTESPRRTPGSTLTSPTNCAAQRSDGWAYTSSGAPTWTIRPVAHQREPVGQASAPPPGRASRGSRWRPRRAGSARPRGAGPRAARRRGSRKARRAARPRGRERARARARRAGARRPRARAGGGPPCAGGRRARARAAYRRSRCAAPRSRRSARR